MAAIFKRPAARRDLVERYVYLAEKFENTLIFYPPHSRGISVIRVL